MNRRLALAILSMLTVLALLGAAVPARTWLGQRDAIAAEEARVAVLARENERLAQRVEELHTDAEVERLAREQYNMVRPGEEAYAILPAPEAPAADGEGERSDVGDVGDVGEEPATEPIANVARSEDQPAWRRLIDTISFWN